MKCLQLIPLFAVFCVCYSCPNGWVTHNTKCYHFSREQETWLGATQMCRFMRGELVEIDDSAENSFLVTQSKLSTKQFFWIALSDVEEEGSWVWMISGQHISTESTTYWGQGQPDNYATGQDCVMMDINLGYAWDDDDCKVMHHYICEKENESGAVIG